jgi:hypothetical protein
MWGQTKEQEKRDKVLNNVIYNNNSIKEENKRNK